VVQLLLQFLQVVFVVARRCWSSAPRLSDYKLEIFFNRFCVQVYAVATIDTRISYSRVRSSKFKIVIFASEYWVSKFVVLDIHDEFVGMDHEEENRNAWSDFADEPNGSPNGGRIVCARCVSWEGHVEETRELQLHGMQRVHGRVSLAHYTLLLCRSYKHLDTLEFGTVLAGYCFLFFLITGRVPFLGIII